MQQGEKQAAGISIDADVDVRIHPRLKVQVDDQTAARLFDFLEKVLAPAAKKQDPANETDQRHPKSTRSLNPRRLAINALRPPFLAPGPWSGLLNRLVPSPGMLVFMLLAATYFWPMGTALPRNKISTKRCEGTRIMLARLSAGQM